MAAHRYRAVPVAGLLPGLYSPARDTESADADVQPYNNQPGSTIATWAAIEGSGS